ncbi:MAG: aminomethyl-transferring glycine dehydrogenase subunit GcvPA [Solirubrobacterales bacterium]|nr:aminomethyl-transferring glycine dehydrogenase subunit GcvPA [Solirubrobacterales bacterium]
MSRYTSATDADVREMLATIGVASIEELFEVIPEGLRLGRALDLPPGQAEQAVYAELRDLAARNVSAEDEISFLGAGMYDHYVPAIVDAITQRSEFLTPYTPYQPEVSQGGLQVMFEFQTAISELTGLPVANASLYEGPSSVASAAYLALGVAKGRRKLVASRGLHPHSRATLETYARGFGAEVVEVGLAGGVTDAGAVVGALDDEVAAVFVQNPNFLGAVEDLEALASAAHEAGALCVASVDAPTLGVLRPPGECGVDVAVGEGQPLGNRLDFGGPSFGFFAATEEHLRRMPGRIAGETTDADGRRGFVLALQTREQHIRRERATHNICTSQALNALAGTIYLAWLGRRGIVELGELLVRRTAYARERLAGVEGVELLHDAPVAREFAVRLDAPVREVVDRVSEEGIAAGYPLARDYPEYEDGLLVAITERRSREDIDRLADALARAIAAASAPGDELFSDSENKASRTAEATR